MKFFLAVKVCQFLRTSSLRVCSAWFEGTSFKFVIFTRMLTAKGITNGRLKNRKTDAYAQHAHQFLTPMQSTSKRKNLKKSLLTLTNGLKSSTEKIFVGPNLTKNLLKNRLRIRVRNFVPLNIFL
jgi:hypothetical protein